MNNSKQIKRDKNAGAIPPADFHAACACEQDAAQQSNNSLQTQNSGHSHGHAHIHFFNNKTKGLLLLSGGLLFAAGILLRLLPEGSLWAFLVFIVSYLLLGGDVLWHAAKNLYRGRVFNESFLMGVATLGAFAIGDQPEAVGVMLFYQVGEIFQQAAVTRSRRSIAALMDIRPDYANLQEGGTTRRIAPNQAEIGDVILVLPGEKVPLDGIVLEGSSELNTGALTGESVPRQVGPGSEVLAGFVNQSGLLSVQVVKKFGQSAAAKILDLVQNAAAKKAPSENFITSFSRYYTPAVVGLAALLALLPPLFGASFMLWFHRALLFLVISCPCALVISIPLTFFAGIGAASRQGILVKGGNFLEALHKLDTVVFDKTGTLTKGNFAVSALRPQNGFTAESLLESAALAESYSSHPIAQSVLQEYENRVHTPINKEQLSGYTEIPGHGLRVLAGGKAILAGSEKLMQREGIAFTPNNELGTKVYVAVNGVFAGVLLIKDELKPDSQIAVAGLKQRGVRKTVMLTGDNLPISQAVAKELFIDELHAPLLPHQKVEVLGGLLGAENTRKAGKLAFVGDGVNDAPVLARADIGIAMGGLGSDAAIEAADVVLMTDEPSKLLTAMDISRKTHRIVVQNIAFALFVKTSFLLLGAVGVATMWEAVFADVGVSLLAVLNALRVQRIK